MDNGMAYRLNGIRYQKDFNIDGIEIRNVLDKKVVSIDELDELIQRGEVLGCEVLRDEKGESHILSTDETLKDLPVIYSDNKFKADELKAVAVLIQNNEPYGYRLEYSGGFLNYSLDVVWELARRGCISNMSAKYDVDSKVIVGKGDCRLWELATIIKS